MSNDPLQAITFEAPSLEELDHLFEGYEFEAFIAKGGMGAVYLANQTSLDRPVAIKILPREFGEDQSFLASFTSEAKLMARLNHANLIGIYDFGNVDGMLYLIMEFVKGKSLHHSSHGKAIIQDKAAEIICDVCHGLSHAHEAGILHRDIKPANILLGKGAKPKIGDFGLARPTGTAETGIIYGTPGYAAPEVVSAPDSVDERTDIFAVGVMFYELLTGHLPSGKYTPITDFVDADPRFDNILRKAIHPKQNMRYTSANSLADDIADILKDLESVTTGSSNKLVTSAKASSSTGLKRNSSPAIAPLSAKNNSTPRLAANPASKPLAETAPPTAIKASNPTARNLVIILLLLGAIAFVWQMKETKQKDISEKDKAALALKKAADDKRKQDALNRRKETDLDTAQRRKEHAAREARKKELRESGLSGGGTKIVSTQEKLEDSQPALSNGLRDKSLFPKQTIFIDNESRAQLFIKQTMTWDQADAYARALGGYPAVCRNKSDMLILSKQLQENSMAAAWVGAGNNAKQDWSWADGTPWASWPNLPATSKQSFVKVTSSGYLKKSKAATKLPSYIEWRMDQTNPGSIDARLQRTSEQLDGTTMSPVFPPGTIKLGARTYLIIQQQMNYSDATKLASISGGHLLVISNNDELSILEDALSRITPKQHKGWLGATKVDDLWQWSTAESWSKFKWQSGHPKKFKRLQFSISPSFQLADAKASELADFTIIEWSRDKDTAPKETITSNSSSSLNLSKTKAKARSLGKKAKKKHEKLRVSNVKKLIFDLEFYLQGLPRNEREDYTADIETIISTVKGGSNVPAALKDTGPTDKARGYTTYAVEKQQTLDNNYQKELEKLRVAYVKQLKKLSKSLAAKGQHSAVKIVKKEISDSGDIADDFASHLGL